MINKVILIGNLGRDPEVRRLENGAVVAKFSIATNENYMDKSGEWQTLTEWHEIVVWRALAERAEKQLKKGMQVYIEGKLTHRSWQDQDGNNRKTTEVVGNLFRLLGKREGGSSFSGGEGYFPSAADEASTIQPKREDSAPAAAPPVNQPPATDGGDDDLPF
ncbi:MAG: single-stranded DNA-binding protein [Bacteroidetes bacterium]|nr:MAG: single-stranded DNA-binding protein [Bacteroidota bacterium]